MIQHFITSTTFPKLLCAVLVNSIKLLLNECTVRFGCRGEVRSTMGGRTHPVEPRSTGLEGYHIVFSTLLLISLLLLCFCAKVIATC